MKRVITFFRNLFKRKMLPTIAVQTPAPSAANAPKKKYKYSYPGFPELKELLKDFGDDKRAIAAKHDVTVRYIDMLLNGNRPAGGEKAKALVAELEEFACINKTANARKALVIDS